MKEKQPLSEILVGKLLSLIGKTLFVLALYVLAAIALALSKLLGRFPEYRAFLIAGAVLLVAIFAILLIRRKRNRRKSEGKEKLESESEISKNQ